MSFMVLILSCEDNNTKNLDEPFAGSSNNQSAGTADTKSQIDLNADAPVRKEKSLTGSSETQCTQGKGYGEGSIKSFSNLDDKLTYLEELVAHYDIMS